MSAAVDYSDFLASKRVAAPSVGFEVERDNLNPGLFEYQRDIVAWALRRGRAALFADTGTGKTVMQLEYGWHVHLHTRRDVLIVAPLAVAAQTVREGIRFGIPVNRCQSQADIRPGINITNYERLDGFNLRSFVCVILDESSILKAFDSKTKNALCESCASVPYRLACTATPAPNDHIELGNHADWLGVMTGKQMLSRWFINDAGNTRTWRLKKHSERDFWRWVASWAVSLRRPSDLGYSDEGFVLPPLHLHEEVVPVDWVVGASDRLFRDASLSATTMHKEMRLTAPARVARVVELVGAEPDEPWAVWCNTNYEADLLKRALPYAVEVRGSESPDAKERKLVAFIEGRERVLITKTSIAGFGLNMQHCARTAFVGLSYSFESLYQALRRFYRYGQTRDVHAYLVVAETEGRVIETVKAKMIDHETMLEGMRAAQSGLQLRQGMDRGAYTPRIEMEVPSWLRPVM